MDRSTSEQFEQILIKEFSITGLIYLPAIVSVTMYFEKYRSLATGIAVCGAGFGTFIFAPLTETLISNYSWREAMLVIAGVVFTCILFGALFRPLAPVPKTDNNTSTEMRKFQFFSLIHSIPQN